MIFELILYYKSQHHFDVITKKHHFDVHRAYKKQVLIKLVVFHYKARHLEALIRQALLLTL